MSNLKEIRVWNAEGQDRKSINLVTDPVSNVDDLLMSIEAAKQNMWPCDNLPFELVYRGQDSGMPLVPRQIFGHHKNLREKLQKMLSMCRDAVRSDYTDHQIYFMMRHAGLPSHLLDWSWQWEVALWFAIHDVNGKLKNRDSSLWALRPLLRDLQGGTVNGSHVNPVFFRADQLTCERSRKQDGCAYQVRFENCGDEIMPMPMDNDLIYSERLLEIPISASMSCADVESWLLRDKPELTGLLNGEQPLPSAVVECCLKFFNKED